MTLETRLDQLIACFNRGVMDVPAGLLDRGARLHLNGVAYETLLGRSADDPLVRMIARGTAGYRFAATALLYALTSAHLTRGAFEPSENTASGTLVLSGTLRGSDEGFEEAIGVDLALTAAGVVTSVEVRVSEEGLARLRAARSA